MRGRSGPPRPSDRAQARHLDGDIRLRCPLRCRSSPDDAGRRDASGLRVRRVAGSVGGGGCASPLRRAGPSATGAWAAAAARRAPAGLHAPGSADGPLPSGLQAIGEMLALALVDEVPATLKDGGLFRRGFDAELDGLHDSSHAAREWIAQLEPRERQRTAIRSLKVGFNQVFGYYLEISHANREAVPVEYVRKQTLVNGERYITPELKEKETLVLNAKGAMVAREQVLFSELCRRIAASGKDLLDTAAWLGELDAVSALASVTSRHRWVRPTLQDEPGIEIVGGRHPLVDAALGPGRFVPNDLRLSPTDQQVVLLSGPNMAGKSTYLRQAGI